MMRERVTIRIVPGGYVCHETLFRSLDDLVAAKRKEYPRCEFMIVEADPQTKSKWAEHGTRIAA